MSESLSFIVRGLLIGLSVAVPVGPMALLCVSRTLRFGQRAGIASGSGVALGDATYATVAAFGLTAVSSFLIDHQNSIRLAGGSFLVFLGWRTMTRATVSADPIAVDDQRQESWQSIATTYVLTLTNPLTILSFAAIFAGFGVATTQTVPETLSLIMAVFAGSMIWWVLLTTIVAKLRYRMSGNIYLTLNRLAGAAIVFFGITAIWSVFF